MPILRDVSTVHATCELPRSAPTRPVRSSSRAHALEHTSGSRRAASRSPWVGCPRRSRLPPRSSFPALRPVSPVAAIIGVVAYAARLPGQFEVANGFVDSRPSWCWCRCSSCCPAPCRCSWSAASSWARRRLSLAAARAQPRAPVLSATPGTRSVRRRSLVARRRAGCPWRPTPIYVAAARRQFAFDFARRPRSGPGCDGTTPRTHASPDSVPVLDRRRARPDRSARGDRAPTALGGRRFWSYRCVALLAVFARERQARIDQALELSSAYRGTAILLGDVIEADDAYTGSHSRDVVELVARGRRPARARRREQRGTPSSPRSCTTSARSRSRRDHQQAGPARRPTSGSS